MREHLATGCPECRQVLDFCDKLARLCLAMAPNRAPEAAVRNARAIFPIRRPDRPERAVRIPIELIYDSFLVPAPAGMRASWQVGWQGALPRRRLLAGSENRAGVAVVPGSGDRPDLQSHASGNRDGEHSNLSQIGKAGGGGNGQQPVWRVSNGVRATGAATALRIPGWRRQAHSGASQETGSRQARGEGSSEHWGGLREEAPGSGQSVAE